MLSISNRVKAVTTDRSQGQRLTVVPIVGPSHSQPAYDLLRDSTFRSVVVTEVSETGSVPVLRVENRLDTSVFLMDGQELRGAKQNRILNTDVLVAAGATVSIPVSCVEQGRWRHVSEQFSAGKSASHRTRSGKLARVHESLRTTGAHDADQSAVWHEVQMCLSSSGALSATSALKDAYVARQPSLDEFRQSLKLPEEAVGVAVFQAGRFQGLDLFDRRSTLSYFWQSLVDSYALDLLEQSVDPARIEQTPEGQVIRGILDRMADAKWESFRSPGDGMDWRTQDAQYAASSLVWNDEVVVHLQVFPKGQPAAEDSSGQYRPRVRRRYGPAAGWIE